MPNRQTFEPLIPDEDKFELAVDSTLSNEIIVCIEKVKVDNPTIKNGIIQYTISGFDKLGYFENIQKRYKDFN